MKQIFLLVFFLAFAQNIWTQRTPEPLSEAEQKLIAELGRDQEFVQVTCERRHVKSSADSDASTRLKTLDAYKNGKEISKLKKSCGTIEGDPIFSYLTVEKGKASIIIDTSWDKFGPKRVYSYQCSELDIGTYFNDLKTGRMFFQKARTDEVRDERATLRCIAGAEEIIF